MNKLTHLNRLSQFVFITFITLFMLASAGSARAGIVVRNPGDTVVDQPIEVSFDMEELLEEEQALLESLAGGSRFEVLGGWEVGSGPGQRSAEIIVDDVDVTSLEGDTFILYVLDEEGEQTALDVIVQVDDVLSVYDPVTDSEAYFRPTVTAQDGVESNRPNWGTRKLRKGRSQDGAGTADKKKKKKKKKPGPRGPKGGPKTGPPVESDPKPELESGRCYSDADCMGAHELCMGEDLDGGGYCIAFEPKGELEEEPKNDPKPDPDSECFADSDCGADEVCILNPDGEGICYEPIFKTELF